MNTLPQPRADALLAAVSIRSISLRHPPHANLSGASLVRNRGKESSAKATRKVAPLLKQETQGGCRL